MKGREAGRIYPVDLVREHGGEAPQPLREDCVRFVLDADTEVHAFIRDGEVVVRLVAHGQRVQLAVRHHHGNEFSVVAVNPARPLPTS